MEFKHGIYRHFKGNTYKTVGIAKHSETLDEMIVYVSTKNPNDLWVRPLEMFNELITRDGKTTKRFEWIAEE